MQGNALRLRGCRRVDALTKAFGTVERSYVNAKATVSRLAAERLLAVNPGGTADGQYRPLTGASQQLDALQSWVWAAVRTIANRISQQPIRAGRRRAMARYGRKGLELRDDVEPLPNHPALELLADPNDIVTGTGLMWQTVASLCLTGRAYWWLPLVKGERWLYYLPPTWIVGHRGKTGYEAWRVRPPGTGEEFDVPATEMTYFVQPSPADPFGAVSACLLYTSPSPRDS